MFLPHFDVLCDLLNNEVDEGAARVNYRAIEMRANNLIVQFIINLLVVQKFNKSSLETVRKCQ